MLACWQSHRNLWKRAVNEGADAIAVFEYDVSLVCETKSALAVIDSLGQQELYLTLFFSTTVNVRNH